MARQRGAARGLFVVQLAVLAVACAPPSPGDRGADVLSTPADPAKASAHLAALGALQAEAGRGYDAVAAAAGMRAVNPAHELALEFAANAVELRSARSSAAAWRCELKLVAAGREGAMARPASAPPAARANRVEYRRGRGLTEWYVNGPRGLEQGFTLHERAAGAGRVALELTLLGDLAATRGEAGTLALRNKAGAVVLRYGELYARDTRGRFLPTAMRPVEGGLALVVDDGGAEYPVEIDPLVWKEQAQLVASGTGAAFGGTVAVDGDTAVVGDSCDPGSSRCEGAVHVFVRSGTGWAHQAKLTASNPLVDSRFGAGVAISGDTVVVSRWIHRDFLYVFRRSGAAWSEEARIGRSLTACGHRAVAVSGDTVAVGTGTGAAICPVSVYVRSGTSWTLQSALWGNDVFINLDTSFGESVAIDGNTIATRGAGPSAYIFVRSGASWAQQAKLVPGPTPVVAGGTRTDGYGPVAVSGDTVALGVPGEDYFGSLLDVGAGYVFVRSGGSWMQQAKLSGVPSPDGQFGQSVGLSGNLAIVGSKLGFSYVFTRTGTSWGSTTLLLPSGGIDSSHVSLSGTTAVVGIRPAAYVFRLLLENGDACTSAEQCHSGFCVDGVCCNSACGGGPSSDCQACSKKAGAATDGTCALLSAKQLCRKELKFCQYDAYCTGTSPTCPTAPFKPSTTRCRNAAGPCDEADYCTGTSADCPQTVKPAGMACKKAAAPCDATDHCDGVSTSCPDTVRPAGTVCRAAAGPCDLADTCDGASKACPDLFKPAGTACRSPAGPCDAADVCSGSSADCTDLVKPGGTFCRAAGGPCDVADLCDGVSKGCADAVQPLHTTCRAAAGPCDVLELCDGVSKACPPDVRRPAGTICRSAAICEIAATCDGSGVSCPANPLKAPGTICRAPSQPCDQAEVCDGVSGTCPPDAFKPAGTECRPAADACDLLETCTGTSAACPSDGYLWPGYVCRPAVHTCDQAETCVGISTPYFSTKPMCPSDRLKDDGAACPGGACHAGSCCTGCWNGASCALGLTAGECGSGGGACTTCPSSNECQTPTCSGGSCSTENKTDGTACAGGQCHAGSCCTGCWDGSACQPGLVAAACGAAGGACTACSAASECQSAGCSAAGSCTSATKPDGMACAAGCANGSCSCSQGMCVIACTTGWLDLNKDLKDGCEYPCAASGPEVCDGKDNDCNGKIDDGACPPGSVCDAAKQLCVKPASDGGVPEGGCYKDGGAGCPPGHICCNGGCVDPLRDPSHCGGCDKPYTGVSKNGCSAGQCVCNPPHFTDCGSSCADTMTDPDNCGACGTICPTGQRYCRSNGPMGSSCATCASVGLAECGGKCISTQFDSKNCGRCGNACASGEVCIASVCVAGNCSLNALLDAGPPPPSPMPCTSGAAICCGQSCVDPLRDPGHCGGCGKPCTGLNKNACSGGQCACNPPHFADCGSSCADTMTDPDNCGACGTICPTGQRYCRSNGFMGSSCATCASVGLAECGGRCISTAFDSKNCGGCGNACASGEVCIASACVAGNCSLNALLDAGPPPPSPMPCTQGAAICCSQSCVDPLRDPGHCGGCNKTCTGLNKTACSGGQCVCNPPHFTDCGVSCADTMTDPDNCGACGTVCPTGQRYCRSNGPMGSSCVSCASVGLAECSGRCVSLAWDNANCGSCGNACTTAQACLNGVCIEGNCKKDAGTGSP